MNIGKKAFLVSQGQKAQGWVMGAHGPGEELRILTTVEGDAAAFAEQAIFAAVLIEGASSPQMMRIGSRKEMGSGVVFSLALVA